MNNLITSIAIASLALMACSGGSGGGGTMAACQEYLLANQACYTTYADATATDVTGAQADTYCEPFTIDVDASTDYFQCMTEAYEAQDCATALPTTDCTW